MKTVRGVKIYNDNNATTPDATIAALYALGSSPASLHSKLVTGRSGKNKNIILILGGSDKGLNISKLVKEIPLYCRAVVLLPGVGTKTVKLSDKELKIKKVATLRSAVKEAMRFAKKGDIVLFSPAFASFGMFENEYDRGDRFIYEVRKLR